MATLQVRDINDGLYSSLKRLADKERRSISQEVVGILESHIKCPHRKTLDTTDDFLLLCGSWQDKRSSAAIVKEIRGGRKNSRRYGRKSVVFD